MPIRNHRIHEYLDTHPIRNYDGTIDSLLNILCAIYIESNPIENDVIRTAFDKADSILSKLSLEDNNCVFNLVLGLCMEYEQNAFAHGVSVGIHLMAELNALP